MGRPWGTGGGNQALALPRNAATGKVYSGINVLILWGGLFEGSFASGRWLKAVSNAQGIAPQAVAKANRRQSAVVTDRCKHAVVVQAAQPRPVERACFRANAAVLP